MTISKYLQKNAAEQDTASNTTLSPNEPTESNSSSLSEPKPSVVTAEQTPENKPKKPLGKLLWESFCIILPPVLLLTAVGVVAYYILCPSKGEFHADCTDTLYWAKATYDSGKLINPDFSYACLLPFGGSLLMLLFLPLFGFSMTTNMMGMLVFSFCSQHHCVGCFGKCTGIPDGTASQRRHSSCFSVPAKNCGKSSGGIPFIIV
ncbi:hypothetical protein [Ruminococcus callidus]